MAHVSSDTLRSAFINRAGIGLFEAVPCWNHSSDQQHVLPDCLCSLLYILYTLVQFDVTAVC